MTPSIISLISRGYRRFVSMRTGICLLAAMAVCLAAGSAAAFDVYHTPFFYLLLSCLTVNTALCGLERCWRSLRRPKVFSVRRSGWVILREIVPGSMPAKAAAVKKLLEGEGYKTVQCSGDDNSFLFGERNVPGRWGSLGMHLSVILIAAGVLYGAQAGFETDITLGEGSSQMITGPGNQALLLRLNSFSTAYYADGTVSDWRCDVSAERAGEAPVRRQVRINHPLVFEHIKVYLASQGVLIRTQVLDAGGRIISDAEMKPGETVPLPQTQGKALRVLHYIPDYDPARPLVSKSQQPRNPYVIYLLSGGRDEGKWLAASLNAAQPLADGTASLVFSVVPVAGLHVKYDPGVPLVWSGFALLLAGFFCMYCLPYRQVGVEFLQRQEGMEIICSGSGPDWEKLRDKLRCCIKSND